MKKTTRVLVFQKCDKFSSILLEHFIKHKPYISEEWYAYLYSRYFFLNKIVQQFCYISLLIFLCVRKLFLFGLSELLVGRQKKTMKRRKKHKSLNFSIMTIPIRFLWDLKNEALLDIYSHTTLYINSLPSFKAKIFLSIFV